MNDFVYSVKYCSLNKNLVVGVINDQIVILDETYEEIQWLDHKTTSWQQVIYNNHAN